MPLLVKNRLGRHAEKPRAEHMVEINDLKSHITVPIRFEYQMVGEKTGINEPFTLQSS